MSADNTYDEEYFERGPQSGKSLYQDYHWLPELTIPMAHRMALHMGLATSDRVLDFGCAKGFTVKAMRLLGYVTYGCDISSYAIDNCDPAVASICSHIADLNDLPTLPKTDWIISKDVLEHLWASDLTSFCIKSRLLYQKAFHVVPIGNGDGRFVVPEYNLDKTHVLARTADWWAKQFESAGWVVRSFTYRVPGIKDNWYHYPKGNGFFVLE